MATATWSWSGTKTNKKGTTYSFDLTGSGITGDVVIRRITYRVALFAESYSSSWRWVLNSIKLVDGPPAVENVTQSMDRSDGSDSKDYVYCEDSTDSTLYDIYKSNTLKVSLKATHSYYDTTSIREIVVEVEYDVPGVTITGLTVSQRGSKYLFSWNSSILAVENVKYTISRFSDNGLLIPEFSLDHEGNESSVSTLYKIPRSDYGNTVSFYLRVSWEYNSQDKYLSVRCSPITPVLIPIYVRYYKDGVGHDCSVSCYDAKRKEWLECEVNYYDGENWIECSTI